MKQKNNKICLLGLLVAFSSVDCMATGCESPCFGFIDIGSAPASDISMKTESSLGLDISNLTVVTSPITTFPDFSECPTFVSKRNCHKPCSQGHIVSLAAVTSLHNDNQQKPPFFDPSSDRLNESAWIRRQRAQSDNLDILKEKTPLLGRKRKRSAMESDRE